MEINWAKIFAEQAELNKIKQNKTNTGSFDFADYLYDFINNHNTKK